MGASVHNNIHSYRDGPFIGVVDYKNGVLKCVVIHYQLKNSIVEETEFDEFINSCRQIFNKSKVDNKAVLCKETGKFYLFNSIHTSKIKLDKIRVGTKETPKSGDILKLSIYLQGDSDSSEESYSILTDQDSVGIDEISDYFYYKYSNPKIFTNKTLSEADIKRIERDATLAYVSQDLGRIYEFIEDNGKDKQYK